jgi:DNA-binding NarL/FixJ family response regulator
MVRLVIAKCNLLVGYLFGLLGAGRDFLVVGDAHDSLELVDVCQRELPDVVLAEGDYDHGGVESALPTLVATAAGVIVICDDPSPDRLTAILASGVSGWLRHDAAPTEVLDAIDAVANGAAVLDPPAPKTLLNHWRQLLLLHTTPVA